MSDSTSRRPEPAAAVGVALALLAASAPSRLSAQPAELTLRTAAEAEGRTATPPPRRILPPAAISAGPRPTPRPTPTLRIPAPGEAGLHAARDRRRADGAPPEVADRLVRLGRRLFGRRGVLRWGPIEGTRQARLRVGLHAASPGPGVRAVLATR